MKKLFKKEEEILIQSNSIPLLLAMVEEFRKAGYLINDEWNKNYMFSPSKKKHINTDFEKGVMFFNHDCDIPTTRQYTLPKDWDTVLELINKSEVKEVKVPKIPKYVRAVNAADKQFTIGKIYEVDIEKSTEYPNRIRVIADDSGSNNGWNMRNFKSSTKKAFEEQNKPKSKFKVGDKVFTLVEYLDKAELKTITKIEGTRIYTDVTTGWWEEEHTILADEEGMLQLLNYLYPIGTAMRCAKDSQAGISFSKVKKDYGGNYYVDYKDSGRNQYVYLPHINKFAEKTSTFKMPFGSRQFDVSIIHKIVTIPDYGNINAEQIKEVIEWYINAPKIKGYQLEATNVNFGCHEGTMRQIFDIYHLIKD